MTYIGKHVRGAGGVRPLAGDPAEVGGRQPRRHPVPERPGQDATTTSAPCFQRQTGKSEALEAFGKALAIRQKLADANPGRHPIPVRPGVQP